jgi:YVTN family beta-propeller protein
MRLSPDGRTLLVSNDGQATQSLQVVDPRTSAVRQTLAYGSPASLFQGLAFSPDGGTAFAAGGGDEKIHTYQVRNGLLTETAPIQLPRTDPAGRPVNLFPAGIDVTPDGRRLVIADHLADAVSVVELATGAVSTVPAGHTPLAVTLAPDGRTGWVTNQGADTVSVIDLSGAAPVVTGTITVGTHPAGAVLDAHTGRLFVADADSDEVSVIDTAAGRVVRTIGLAPYHGASVGSNPVGLALSADGGTLYVANSGNNDIDVVDVAHGRVDGSIPTAWYPSAVVATADRLFVANAKGLGAGPNDQGNYPNPTSPTPTDPNEYAGSMMVGTLSTVPLPLDRADLARWTTQVARNDAFRVPGFGGPVGRPGARTPIRHVIYVVKENRTYDQEFGSLGKGNGDPSLNLFGEESAPNSRALERQYVTFDNFYADAEISAQGWNWAVAANSNPFSEALWPANYSGRNAPYPSENGDPAIAPNRQPADAYIWDRLADAGVSFRNYGFYVGADPTGAFHADDPRLDANTDHAFRGYDLACPDSPDTFTPRKACGTARYAEWKREFDQYVAGGNLPTVEFVRLPNDHTAGTRPGWPTARAYVADNDLAVGRLVDDVSHSPYWADTAVFVTEDDAQNGPDHVDAHRTLALLVSPYTRTGAVDSTFYSTASMLRTVEDLIGVRPLTQFDAYSTPMSGAFGRVTDPTPYTAERPAAAGNVLNPPTAPMAAESARQPLAQEDRIDMDTFNQAIWLSIKGPFSVMPAPRHTLRTPATADRDH